MPFRTSEIPITKCITKTIFNIFPPYKIGIKSTVYRSINFDYYDLLESISPTTYKQKSRQNIFRPYLIYTNIYLTDNYLLCIKCKNSAWVWIPVLTFIYYDPIYPSECHISPRSLRCPNVILEQDSTYTTEHYYFWET